MMEARHLFSIVTLAALLLACDPVRVLMIETEGNPNTSVTVYANKNILRKTSEADPEETFILSVDSGQDTAIFYGIGTWASDDLTSRFAQHFDSIIIVNARNKIILNNQEDITAYLLKHRSGFAKSKLIIKAK